MKVFKILKYFLTEKMDDLTQQLFNDVQKEENQRMYVIWILFLWNSIHFFSFPPFLSPSANVLCWHQLWISPCSWALVLVLKYFMQFRKSTSLFVGESYAGNQTVLAFAISCLFLCLWELKGSSGGNGFFGDVLRIWSGVEEQLMATPIRTPGKWIWKDRMEGFSVRERQCL